MSGARGVRTYSERDIVLALTSVAVRMGRAPTAQEYAAAAEQAQVRARAARRALAGA
jgi:hypothetical protein